MKDRFNGSRFLALAKKDYRENMLFNLIFIAIMLVAILLAVTQGNPFQVEYSYLPNERIKSDYISHYKDLYIQIFWGLFVVFSACYALRSFRGIMQPDRTLANLMLPVSNLERYLLAFLNSTVVIFIVYLLLFYGVTSITNSYKYVGLKEFSFVTGGWFGNELPQFGPGQEVTHTEIGNIFQVVSENQIKIQQAYSGGHIANSFIPFSVLGIWCIAISCWLGVISMFMWGAITFRKYAFLLTLLIQVLVTLRLGVLGFWIIGQMAKEVNISTVSLYDLGIYGSPETYQLPSWYWLCCGVLFPVGYQLVIWLKLRTKQIA